MKLLLEAARNVWLDDAIIFNITPRVLKDFLK